MPEDVQGNVQQESVSQEQTSQTQEATQTEGQTGQEQEPLTTDKVQQMIEQAVQLAKETGRRELQAQQDRNKAEQARAERAERRAKAAEGLLSSTRGKFSELDPDVAKDLELAQLRSEKEQKEEWEKEDNLRRQQAEMAQAIQGGLTAHLKELEIDPNDERIDWAEDAKNYVEGRTRFDASVAKILKENQKTVSAGFEKRLQDLEKKLTDAGVEANSVSTATSQGVAPGSDVAFMKAFASQELPMSKENIDRYNKIIEES
jgi:hypothetical protein